MELTCAKRNNASIGGAEKSGVDTRELAIDDTVQLGVAWGPLTEGRGGSDTIDIERVARVLAVRDRIGDESLLILDTWLLGKIDHRIRVVLLRACIRTRQQ